MTKMPHARVKTLEASFPTLVLEGRACLRRRRTQARGGSNSMVPAPGWADRVACLGAAAADGEDLVVEDSGSAAEAVASASGAAGAAEAAAGSGAAGASAGAAAGMGLAGAGLLIFCSEISMLQYTMLMCFKILGDSAWVGACVALGLLAARKGRRWRRGGRPTKNEPSCAGFLTDKNWWQGRLSWRQHLIF